MLARSGWDSHARRSDRRGELWGGRQDAARLDAKEDYTEKVANDLGWPKEDFTTKQLRAKRSNGTPARRDGKVVTPLSW